MTCSFILIFMVIFTLTMHIHTCFIILFNSYTYLFLIFIRFVMVVLLLLIGFRRLFGKIEDNLLFCWEECKGGVYVDLLVVLLVPCLTSRFNLGFDNEIASGSWSGAKKKMKKK